MSTDCAPRQEPNNPETSISGPFVSKTGRNFLSKDRNSVIPSSTENLFPNCGENKLLKLSEKDRQFEFYLKSAQKAIDIMRNQQVKQMQFNMINYSGTSIFP